MENENPQGQNPQEIQKIEELGKELQGIDNKTQPEPNQQQPNPIEPKSPVQEQTKTPEIQPSSNGGMNKVFIAAIVILLISLLAFAGYYFGFVKNKTIEQSPSPAPTLIPVPTELPKVDISEWETYTNNIYGFSIKYPKEVNTREDQDDYVIFSLLGPTQKEGTEFFDGISLTFRFGSYTTDDFEAFVNEKISEINSDGLSTVQGDKKQVTFNSIPGYSFTVEGLGIFDYIYLDKESGEYLEIVDATKDPASQGFNDTVEAMLSSLELIKTATGSPSPTSTP